MRCCKPPTHSLDIGADSLFGASLRPGPGFFCRLAADFARSVQARRQLQLALGDMGWAYANLGDF